MSDYNVPHNGVFWGVGDADDNVEDQIHVCIGQCPVHLVLLNVSASVYFNILWLRTLACLSSNIMEGIAYYDSGIDEEAEDIVTQEDLEENQGVACYAGGDVLRYCETNDRWEYETAVAGTWADATEKFVDECGDCIFPKRNPTPVHHDRRFTPPGFRIGYNSSKLNLDGEEIHYAAHFGRFCNCTTPGGNTIDGGTEADRQ